MHGTWTSDSGIPHSHKGSPNLSEKNFFLDPTNLGFGAFSFSPVRF